MKKIKLMGIILAGVFACVLFTGCFEKMLKTEAVKEPLANAETYFLANIYDKDADTEFNSEGDDYITDSNYFVKVATEVEKEISKIKINQITYTSTDTISLEVGNGNKLIRKAYKVEDAELFISAPLLYLNAGESGCVNISFPNGGYKAFNLDVLDMADNTLKITVTSPNENVLSAVAGKQNTYKFASDTFTNSIFITLKDGTEALSDSAIVLVQKVANPSLTNQSSAFSYLNPTVPSGQTEKGIELFPGYNGGNVYTTTSPADHKLIYNIYVIGVGGQIVELNFENTFGNS